MRLWDKGEARAVSVEAGSLQQSWGGYREPARLAGWPWMPSLLTCSSRRRSLWRSPTVGANGTTRRVGRCISASYLRQAVSRSSLRPRSAVRRCWSDSQTISRNSSSRRHAAAGVRPDQPARATPILQRHHGTSRPTLRGGSAPQQAVTSLASATTARTNTTRNLTVDRACEVRTSPGSRSWRRAPM